MMAYSLSLVPCNDICLRSGKIVEPVITEDAPRYVHKEGGSSQHPSDTVPIIEDAEHPLDGTAETSNDKPDNTQPTQLIRQPPYPERLMLPIMGGQPQFNLLGELRNLYVKIPLLQALQDVPIYARTIWYLCTKKPGRKPRDPPTVHVIGNLSTLITTKAPVTKYDDPGNPTVIVQVGQT